MYILQRYSGSLHVKSYRLYHLWHSSGATVRVRLWVRSCGIFSGQSGGFKSNSSATWAELINAGCCKCAIILLQLPGGSEEFPKAVMVWIHGGGFTMGDGNFWMYGPDYLVAEGVVLVTLNYRLGPLGNHNITRVTDWLHTLVRMYKYVTLK